MESSEYVEAKREISRLEKEVPLGVCPQLAGEYAEDCELVRQHELIRNPYS